MMRPQLLSPKATNLIFIAMRPCTIPHYAIPHFIPNSAYRINMGMCKMRTADRGLQTVLTCKLRTGICRPDIADQWVTCGLITGMRNSIVHILWAIRPIYIELSGAYNNNISIAHNSRESNQQF